MLAPLDKVVVPFAGLCVLLGVGQFLRMRVRLFQKLYLPSSVIGGLIGLILLQSLRKAGHPLPELYTLGWGMLPGILINVVFACLFLGVMLPRFGRIWRHAGAQLAYGQTVAWGQYIVGVGLVLVLLGPVFKVPAMFGGLIPVGFEGGHGTAAGLEATFEDLGWEEGKDLALTSATAGILGAVIFGMILINWAVRRGYTVRKQKPEDIDRHELMGVISPDRRPSAGKLTVSPGAIESLTLHLVIVGLAVLLGYLIKQGMWGIEKLINAGLSGPERGKTTAYILVKAFPLFPLCMLGGLIVQIVEQRFDKHKLIDRGLMHRIQNTALDFLVVAAIAMIKIEVVAAVWKPFVVLIAAGIAWNIFCVIVLARRMLPDAWFERSIAEMGQSMGVTATGLLLLRVVDPEYETAAADSFAYKQILHEPFMGGGLWTSTAIPLLAVWGALPVFLIACAAVAIWLTLVFVLKIFRRPQGAT